VTIKRSSCQCSQIYIADASGAFRDGVGSPTFIELSDESPDCLNSKAEAIESHFKINLAHELIHAARASYGESKHFSHSYDDSVWNNLEEYLTIMGNFFQTTPLLSVKMRSAENKICQSASAT